MAGGPPFTLPGGSAELYNPDAGTFTDTGGMAFPTMAVPAGKALLVERGAVCLEGQTLRRGEANIQDVLLTSR